jgi:chlorobactene glucosyltransferase
MAHYLTHDLISHLTVFQALVLLVILSNTWLLHRARRHLTPQSLPMVSVLVPARNEETNVAGCVQSLLAQDYPSFEVLALDDQSSDGTRAVLEQIACSQPGLKVLLGSPPPEGWLGKNWACAQLARRAQGDLLFFTDADTIHQPRALRIVVTALMCEQADLLTGFPRQEAHTWGERLLVPFFSWACLCFNPLCLAYWLRLPALCCAVGQMMLFRRQAYQAIGGHESIGPSVVDDLALARRVKASGLRWRMVRVTDLISCRMYRGSGQALAGFAKNLFAAFGFRLLAFSFAYGWLMVMIWEPLFVSGLLLAGRAPQARVGELALCIGLSLLLWLLPYLELGVSPGLALLYPVTVLANEVAAIHSLRLSLAGGLRWKERKLARPHWRWL